MKIALTDLETTGLNPATAEIIEIGCFIFDTDTLKVSEKIDIKVKPRHIERSEPKALEVNGYTKEAWKHAISIEEAMYMYVHATNGTCFMAYNAFFDLDFLKATGAPLGFVRPTLDLLSMAYAKLPPQGSYSLKNICLAVGIEPEHYIHRALGGVEKEFELYKILTTIK